MNYSETLRKARELGICPIALDVAYEFHCQIDNEDIALSPQAFEDACRLIERAYLKSCDISIESITRALIYMWVENNTPLDEINVWNLLDKASYY